MWYGSPDGFDAELLIGDHDIGQIMGVTNTIGLRDSNEPYFVRKLSKKDLCDVFADFPKNPGEQMRHFLTSLLKT